MRAGSGSARWRNMLALAAGPLRRCSGTCGPAGLGGVAEVGGCARALAVVLEELALLVRVPCGGDGWWDGGELEVVQDLRDGGPGDCQRLHMILVIRRRVSG